VGYFLVGFSASHTFYFQGERVVLFYSVDFEVGESTMIAAGWDMEGLRCSGVLQFNGDSYFFHEGL